MKKRMFIAGLTAVSVALAIQAQPLEISPAAAGKAFDGIGAVNGGGATSVLLRAYPEPQRSQILDLVFRPKFGASVSTMLVEIPGDGNSTQGSMPSHAHYCGDANFERGYMWWGMVEAKRRNPQLAIDATAWSAPAWVGNIWSQKMADYYVDWLAGLREHYALELDALGCHNEKGYSYDFAKRLRRTMNERGFKNVRLHGFDNWGENKMDFLDEMQRDPELADAIDAVSAHTFSEIQLTPGQRAAAMAGDDARWLFVAPWTTPFVFSRQNDDAFWKQFLSEELVLTRDEVARAGSYALTVNKQEGIFAKGEHAVVSCHTAEVPLDSLFVRVYHNNNLVREFSLLPASCHFTVLDQALDSTCAVSVELCERLGQPAAIGYVVAPEGFSPGYLEPADLMQYWDNQKKLLKALPMQVKTAAMDVPRQYQGRYTCQDVEINCLGPSPVRAYMAKPVGARKKSLPVIILCRAAGVAGDWCRCQVGECVGNAALGGGALSLDLNAHGMLNGQPTDYYQMLESGMLRNYFYHNAADRETYYFRGMYLRLLRAIEYMTRQPEWDGKRIIVIGESQGGGQAIAAAGLDRRVTAVCVHVPAMQDLGGARAGRRSGWPQPIEAHPGVDAPMLDATLPYFDGALLIRHSRAEIFCEMGLVDTTCPPAGIWASLNGAPGKKTVRCVPFRAHAWPQGQLYTYWREHFLLPRMDFISSYLK